MADGWETADRAPVYRLQNLSPPDPGRPTLVHPGLPQNLCPPGGARALIRHGPGQSESMDPRPAAALLRAVRRLGAGPARPPLAPGQAPGYPGAAAPTVVTPLEEESAPVVAVPTTAAAAPLLPMTGPNGASSGPRPLRNRP